MNKQETVSVYLPTLGNGPFVEGAINGVNFRIRTGVVVEVPRRIAKVLGDSRKALCMGKRAVEAYAASGGKKLL